MPTDRPCVLIAEDEPAILLAVAECLHEQGYHVHLAETSSQAMRLLARSRCDIAILDFSLSDATSAGIATILERQGTPYIVIWGVDRASIGWEGPFLSKSFSITDLLRTMKQLQSKEAEVISFGSSQFEGA